MEIEDDLRHIKMFEKRMFECKLSKIFLRKCKCTKIKLQYIEMFDQK